jgi:ribosomal protein S18 acetylase RimI-like enzyme
MAEPNFEKWLNTLGKSIKETFQTISSEMWDLFEERPSYVLMRLPVSKITIEFENSLRNKVKKNIFDVHIRIAEENDIDNIMRIYNTAWYSSPMPFRTVKKETFLNMFKKPNIIFLIAKVNSIIDCGFILIHFEGIKKEIGIIDGLGILPKFQNKGIGTILAIAAWDYFKKNGVKELRCEVHKDSKIIYSFIKSLGFKEYHKGDKF